MQSLHLNILVPSLLTLALAACANNSGDNYDTSNPYGAADYGQADTAPYQPVNPVYDTPAAYEESSPATSPNIPSTPPAPSAPARIATVHTVVRGDTLWGLSRKYNVTVDAIKQANGMTSDTVVLGSKLQIPAR